MCDDDCTHAGLPMFDREPQDLMVYPGQIAYLNCKLASANDHRIQIQWLKDEQPLIFDESRMTVLPSGKFWRAHNIIFAPNIHI